MRRRLGKGGALVVDGVGPPQRMEPGTAPVVSGMRWAAVARVGRSERPGPKTILELHHLVGSESAVEHVVERHELTFTDEEYQEAFITAGLDVETTERPMADRDRYVGTKPG